MKNCFENNNSFPAGKEVSSIFSKKIVVVKTVGSTGIVGRFLVESPIGSFEHERESVQKVSTQNPIRPK